MYNQINNNFHNLIVNFNDFEVLFYISLTKIILLLVLY